MIHGDSKTHERSSLVRGRFQPWSDMMQPWTCRPEPPFALRKRILDSQSHHYVLLPSLANKEYSTPTVTSSTPATSAATTTTTTTTTTNTTTITTTKVTTLMFYLSILSPVFNICNSEVFQVKRVFSTTQVSKAWNITLKTLKPEKLLESPGPLHSCHPSHPWLLKSKMWNARSVKEMQRWCKMMRGGLTNLCVEVVRSHGTIWHYCISVLWRENSCQQGNLQRSLISGNYC